MNQLFHDVVVLIMQVVHDDIDICDSSSSGRICTCGTGNSGCIWTCDSGGSGCPGQGPERPDKHRDRPPLVHYTKRPLHPRHRGRSGD